MFACSFLARNPSKTTPITTFFRSCPISAGNQHQLEFQRRRRIMSAPTKTALEAEAGTKLTIRLPDDFHHHVRDGPKTAAVLKFASQRFGRCLMMPNTKPPVVNTEMAIKYKQHVMKSLPPDSALEPVMTLYLTDNTTAEDIREAHKEFGKYVACKYYPAGATTNSDSGVTNVKNLFPVLEEMQKLG